MTRPRRRLLLALGAAALVVLTAAAALPGVADALEQFRAGRFREARAALDEPGADADSPEAILLKACLAQRPDAAAPALEGLAASVGPRDPQGAAALLDVAAIRFAEGRYQDVVKLLAPLVADDAPRAPGRALVLAGLARRALGDTDGAAALLATVKPDDPAFTAARTALGDLALAGRDPAKALRYYENADDDARAGAGRWQALRQAGDAEEAERLRRQLAAKAPGSIAVLEINRLVAAETDEAAARQALTPTHRDDDAAPVAPAAGRYTLQLGAFSDRGLALDLMRRYGDAVPGLRIDTVRDDRGQFLYKVRAGSFVNPALARAEAEKLKGALGVDVFVTETGD